MVVAAIAKTEEQMVKTEQEKIDELVARTVTSPVSASITGQPTIDRAMKDQSIDDAKRGVASRCRSCSSSSCCCSAHRSPPSG